MGRERAGLREEVFGSVANGPSGSSSSATCCKHPSRTRCRAKGETHMLVHRSRRARSLTLVLCVLTVTASVA